MLRALTIRFWDVYIGAAISIALANILEPPPAVVILVFFAYIGASMLIIGNYCIDHEDEISSRPPPEPRER